MFICEKLALGSHARHVQYRGQKGERIKGDFDQCGNGPQCGAHLCHLSYSNLMSRTKQALTFASCLM
jgi:hypothetical protein